MTINDVPIADAYAEAFDMFACRVIVTAVTPQWTRAAGQAATGFATSIIRCDVEAGIERELPAGETPDGRPGISLLFFARTIDGLAAAVTTRIGQCVLTCATTACFNGLPQSGETFRVGAALAYFGDGHQRQLSAHGRDCWTIPVMDGEFTCEDHFTAVRAIGGGNFMILGSDSTTTLAAAEAAANAARLVPDVILPFPLGVVRSGSKVGSQYPGMGASTNHRFCPTLRGVVDDSLVPEGCKSVYEIVIDGLSRKAVASAMRGGIRAACMSGVLGVSAGSYGGKLGQHKFALREIAK